MFFGQDFRQGLKKEDKKNGLLRSLGNIEGKNEEQLKTIKEQEEEQLKTVKDQGVKQLKNLEQILCV